jgi:hypothetical protein
MNDSGDESSIPDAVKESAELENDASALINKVNLSFYKFNFKEVVINFRLSLSILMCFILT